MEEKKLVISAPVGASGDDVTTWALPEGAIARLGRGSVFDIAFSPDEQYLAVGTRIGLWLYELSTLSPIALWETDRGYIHDVAFSPDSRWIAAHTLSEALRVWDIQNKACIAEMEFTKKSDRFGLTKPVFSQDGERLVAFNKRREHNMKVQVWCPRTGTQLSETEIPYSPTCFSPDLRLLAGKNYDRNTHTTEFIAVWCVETGEQVARLEWSERRGRLCFSPCGKFLAAGGSEGRIHVWDVESGNLEATYTKHEDAQMHPYYPPEGGLIAAVASPSQFKIEVWHLEKGKKIDTFGHQSSGNFVRFSESGTQLACNDPHGIKIWTKGKPTVQPLPTIQGHSGTVSSLAFAPDEKTLVTAYRGRTGLLWDIASKTAQRPTAADLPGPGKILDVYPSSSGKIFSTSQDENILKVWELGSSEPIAEILIPEPGLLLRTSSEALVPTGHRLAAAGRDRNIYVWEYKPPVNDIDKRGNWENCAILIGHPKSVGALAFNPDGKRLASISIDRTALLWDVDTEEQITEMDLPPPQGKRTYRYTDVGVAFSPLGDIIVGGHQGDIVLWDATDGKTLTTLSQPEGSQRPIAFCFSPCGQYLASGVWWLSGLQKVPIRLWKVATGENIVTFWGHTTDVQCFAFSQDGTLLVSGGHDGVIYLWDLTPYL